MKKRLKKILTLAMVSAMLLGNTFTVQAASHAKGCAATGQTQVCSTYRTTNTDKHHLHTNVYCSRTAYIYDHYYACSGCGVKLSNGQTKICTRSHQYCPTETSLCK